MTPTSVANETLRRRLNCSTELRSILDPSVRVARDNPRLPCSVITCLVTVVEILLGTGLLNKENTSTHQ